MRLGSVTLSATLSAALLSGCSFIGGQSSNPYANQKASHYGQYGQAAAGQNCQIATPQQAIPRGCRPEQVTIGVNPQQTYGGMNYGANGFPQQPQFGQPQYTDGAYGSAVGQTAAVSYHTPNSQKRKPRLRGSLSIGADKSIDGNLIETNIRGIIGINGGYNPQTFNQGSDDGTAADGLVTSTRYTANNLAAGDLVSQGDHLAIYRDGLFDSSATPDISFTNAWSTPTHIKGGVEYILNNKFTTFANVGYTYAEGETSEAVSVDGTLYRQVITQPYDANLDPAGDPNIATTFIPSQNLAKFSYDVSALEQFDLEVGGRHYFNPLVKSEGYRTITPFVGASVGASRVNAVDVDVRQSQTSYQAAFEGDSDASFDVPADSSTRIYDAQWLPQGQLNVGAEWQLTPGFALAAETGLKVQGAREYADFTNSAGETISGKKGNTNISIPLTLRGSINF